MAKISVIITAFKDRGWIDEAIDSAMKQTFKDYDILFVSDGNPWIEHYATSRNLPFICYPKQNYSSLVNAAVREVTGEWIKILHDDDILTLTSLQDLWDAREDSDLVYGNAIIFWDENKTDTRVYEPPKNVGLRNLLPVTCCPVNFEAELLRRDTFLEMGGFDTELHYSEDYDLLIRYLIAGKKLKYCDKSVVWYRHHQRQITGSEPELKDKEAAYMQNKFMDEIVKLIDWK